MDVTVQVCNPGTWEGEQGDQKSKAIPRLHSQSEGSMAGMRPGLTQKQNHFKADPPVLHTEGRPLYLFTLSFSLLGSEKLARNVTSRGWHGHFFL